MIEDVAETNLYFDCTFHSEERIDNIGIEVQGIMSDHDTDNLAVIRLWNTDEVRYIKKDLYGDEWSDLLDNQEDEKLGEEE